MSNVFKTSVVRIHIVPCAGFGKGVTRSCSYSTSMCDFFSYFAQTAYSVLQGLLIPNLASSMGECLWRWICIL